MYFSSFSVTPPQTAFYFCSRLGAKMLDFGTRWRPAATNMAPKIVQVAQEKSENFLDWKVSCRLGSKFPFGTLSGTTLAYFG